MPHVTRNFVSDIVDSQGQSAELSVTFVGWGSTHGGEGTEPAVEYYELKGVDVTLNDLVRRFGKGATKAFLDRATENAR